VKYNVYLRENVIKHQFVSTDRSRVELAARLLRLAGVGAEVKKVGGRDVWYVEATTDMLATGHKELRDAVRKVVEEAPEKGWVDEKKARRWLEKLKKGRLLKEGWPKYEVRLVEGALEVGFSSTNSDEIEHEARRFRDMGLVEDRHFTVRMLEGGRKGYVSILREGLAYAAWLSIHGFDEQQKPAAEFVNYILERAEKEGKEVYEKAKEIVEKGGLRIP
jgi:hypothetical protein